MLEIYVFIIKMHLDSLYILYINYLNHRFIKCQLLRIQTKISMEINSKPHLVQFIDFLSARVLNIML